MGTNLSIIFVIVIVINIYSLWLAAAVGPRIRWVCTIVSGKLNAVPRFLC